MVIIKMATMRTKSRRRRTNTLKGRKVMSSKKARMTRKMTRKRQLGLTRPERDHSLTLSPLFAHHTCQH